MSEQRRVPADWRQTSISALGGRLPDVVQTGPFGAQLHSEDYVKEGIPFILIKNLRNGRVDESDMPRISEDDAKRLSMYALQKGDVIFTRVGRVGSCFLAEARHSGWIISGQMLRIRLPESEINHRYLIHALNSYPAQKRIGDASVGSTRQSINTKILSSLELLVPSPSEQRGIAAVLDTVDEAIAKTESVIAKLEHVRAGLLHDLLTCGLDENGELRDSSAHPDQFQDSRLGRIPREWEIKTCQNVCREIVVGIVVKPAQYYVEEGIPVLRSANVREEGIQMTDLVFISDESNALLNKSIIQTGDVVTVRTGYPGTSCVVPPHLDGVNCVDLIISRPNAEIVPAFLALWINSPFGRDQVLRVQGGLAQQHFNVGELKTLLIAKPDRDEQARIIERIATLDSHISLELETKAKLSLLKSGLMTDLLTGRVRVPEGIVVAS